MCYFCWVIVIYGILTDNSTGVVVLLGSLTLNLTVLGLVQHKFVGPNCTDPFPVPSRVTEIAPIAMDPSKLRSTVALFGPSMSTVTLCESFGVIEISVTVSVPTLRTRLVAADSSSLAPLL